MAYHPEKEADQCSTVLEQQDNNRHDRESGKQFYQMNNQPTENKSSKSNEIFELLNSDEFVNACLTCATIILIFSGIMFSLVNFRNKLNQGQQNPLISTTSRQS